MRSVILAMVFIAALFIAGCNEEQITPTAWIMGGTDVDGVSDNIIGRLGIQNPDGIEFGAESTWAGVRGADQSYGVYALAELAPGPAGTPYLGYHASVANDWEDGGLYGPIAGTIIEISKIESVVEFQYLDYTGNLADFNPDYADQYKIYAGIRLKF